MEFIRERIEHRAYDLYLKRGKIPGFDKEDWQQAEKEILAEIEAGKKKEEERRAAVKAAPATTPGESKPVTASVKTPAPGQTKVSEKAAEGAQPKARISSAVKPAAKIIKKKR